ncbi:RNA polymerase sigma factor [Dasania marina]|uniref:RNA polymerase sigma factor n=1 Tax=Dasania marina TaxID=471499 RepID=UPI00037CF998|nr:RNA polymerase sigma factor [Dasania marina]
MTATPAQHQYDEQRWSGLMAQSQQGNEAEYRELLTELAEAINHYLIKRLGPQHFIEDCVQDAFIAIHQARHSYDSKRLFRSWLFAIVRHKAIDALRKQKRYYHNLEQTFNQQQLSEQEHAPSQDEHMAQGQLVAALAPAYREAITLTKIVDLSSAEAASELCISEGALKVRVHRAIGQLRKSLEKDTYE